MANVPLTFFFIGLVIVLGFLTARIFQATRVPDIPILICIGLVLGPLNRAAPYAGWSGYYSPFLEEHLNVDTFRELSPFFSQLALIVILFESGLKLDFSHVARGFRPALAHTLPLMALTIAAIAGVVMVAWGASPLIGVILGLALSNVGQTVSAPIIRQLRISDETRSIYFVEMALYDVLSIPLLVGLLEFAKGAGGADASLFLGSIARVASVSLVLGVIGGLIWIAALSRLENYPYTYMVTVASLLLLYGINSFSGGSGAIAALVFGLVIGNRNSLLRALGTKRRVSEAEGEKVLRFTDEISFFLRSFFFVFLGIVFSTGYAVDPDTGERVPWNVSSDYWPLSAHNGTATLFLLGCGLVVAAIVVVRYLVVKHLSARRDADHRALWVVFGRGLGTAVLCAFPFTLPEYDDPTSGYHQLLAPYEELFLNAALLVILLTVAGTSLTFYVRERHDLPEKGARA